MLKLGNRPQAAIVLDNISGADFIAVDFHCSNLKAFCALIACGGRLKKQICHVL
jgi:hypothetical protein